MADSISGLSGSGGGDMMRIVGMASGMDIDGMIKKMMLAEGKKVDVVKQQRQAIVWKQEMYQDIIKDVKDLQNTYFSATSADSLILSKAYSDFKVDSTDSAVATAIAGQGSISGNYTVKVDQLAEVAIKSGSSLYNQVEVSDKANWEDKEIAFKIGESTVKTIKIGSSIADKKSIAEDINKQISSIPELSGKLSVSYVKDGSNEYIKFNKLTSDKIEIDNTTVISDLDSLKELKSITSTSTLAELGFQGADTLKFKIKYNGIESLEINVNKDSKISDILEKINTDSQLKGNVTAVFDNTSGKISIQSVKTGSTETIEITGLSEGSTAKLSSLGLNTSLVQGKDALATITKPDGSNITATQQSNNFEANGVKFNLTGKGEATINVAQDTEKTFDRFVKFIDKYNTLIDKINTKLTEKKNYDYKPLTDAQKKDMKDDEIKAWEEKAKKGILRNDDNLKNMLSELRNTFFSKVEGVSINFGKTIGLDTDGKASKAGQIKFSDDTGELFKQTLKDNPNQIMDLFNKTYTLNSDDLTKSKEEQRKITHDNSGIFQRINNILKDNVGAAGVTLNNAILTQYVNKQEDYSIYGSSGSNTLPDQIYRKDNLIKQLNTKLKDKENSLYKKFSALEVVMNKYNSQQGWLAQQFGG